MSILRKTPIFLCHQDIKLVFFVQHFWREGQTNYKWNISVPIQKAPTFLCHQDISRCFFVWRFWREGQTNSKWNIWITIKKTNFSLSPRHKVGVFWHFWREGQISSKWNFYVNIGKNTNFYFLQRLKVGIILFDVFEGKAK